MEESKLYTKLKAEQEVPESCFTALCWLDPEKYNLHSKDKINSSHFLNDKWEFFFSLGRHMYDQNVKTFDDVSVYKAVNELDAKDQFDKYGGFPVVREVMEELRDSQDNDESYYTMVKKGFVLSELTHLFGEKVLKKTQKYDYHKLTADTIITYWNDKLNTISMGTDNKFDTYHLFDNMDKFIEKTESGTNRGMPLYKSNKYTKMINGWAKGHLYMFGAFGNAGKTSFLFNKVAMSCIKNNERLVVIANEEDIDSFTEKLYVSVLGVELVNKGIDRNKFKQAGFTEEDRKKIQAAKDWVAEVSQGDNALIDFVFMEEYIIDDVKKVIRHYNSRGYENFIIDTHKVSERSSHDQRWVSFVEDTKQLYKMCRPNGGGLNLRMWLNFQLADHAKNRRYLDFDAIGEGKAAKNEASVVNMIRAIWDSEFSDGKNKLYVYKYDKNGNKSGDYLDRTDLDKGETYYLLFQPKSRFSSNNDNGQPVLVFKVNFNFNSWEEIGYTTIANDKMY